jgi:type VII secretion integral membrane protein EccD
VLTAYSRVTVVCGSRKVDLALPSVLPVADVVPQVLRFCAPNHDRDQPAAWALARLGGGPLALGTTLGEAGIVDGDVLELRSNRGQGVRPAIVEDVRDALEDSVDAAGGWWAPSTSRAFALCAGAVVLGLLALLQLLLPELLGGAPGDGDDARTAAALLGAVVATAVAAASTAWGARTSGTRVTQACAVALVLWGITTGATLAAVTELDGSLALVLAAAGGVLAGLGARLVATATTALASGVVVVGIVAVVTGVVGATSLDGMHVSRVAPVLALLCTGVLPRLALAAGGLASADYRIRNAGRLGAAELATRHQQSDGMLVGGLAGVCVVVAWGVVELAASDAAWDPYLAGSVGLVAVLRSRVFSRFRHMVGLRALGVLTAVALVARVAADEPDLRPWLVVLAAVLAAALVAVSSLPLSPVTRARIRRVLNVAEFLVVVDMVVVLAGSLGLFDWVAGLT